jgi:hypothetical protein
MGRSDEQATVAWFRCDLRRLCGEYAEAVLLFMLRTYRHHSTQRMVDHAPEQRYRSRGLFHD